jgi:hypothetical protein
MYIFEWLANKINNKKTQISSNEYVEQKDYENCNHVFFPIDSTGEILACSKCGFLIKKADLKIKPKNPFS